MSDKILDWSKIADKTAFDDVRREALGIPTFKELMNKAYKRDEERAEHNELVKSQEPFLRNSLLKHMVNKLPIKVLHPFMNPTESLGQDSGDELDDFYWNGASSKDPIEKSARLANAGFQEVMETIPAGAELVFKSWNRSLGQWVFNDNNSRKEYVVYDKPLIMFQKAQIRNPGFYGLLFNTHLIQELGE